MTKVFFLVAFFIKNNRLISNDNFLSFPVVVVTIKQLFQSTRPKVIFCDGSIYLNVAVIGKILKAKMFTLKEHRLDVAKIEDLLEPTNAELFYV